MILFILMSGHYGELDVFFVKSFRQKDVDILNINKLNNYNVYSCKYYIY